jgi:hypothetical protein
VRDPFVCGKFAHHLPVDMWLMDRARLERVNAQPDVGVAKTQRKLRDAIPSVDELSSAVSRVNVAPWEDPFALALGQAAPIEEEGKLPLA